MSSFCCRNIRGPGRWQDMSKVTASKWSSQGQGSALCYFSTLTLPSCQEGNVHEGSWFHVPTTQRRGEQSMFINTTLCTEESLCSPVLQGPFPPEAVLHGRPRVGEAPDTVHVAPMRLQQSISPRIWTWAANVEMRCLTSPGLSFINLYNKEGNIKATHKEWITQNHCCVCACTCVKEKNDLHVNPK